MSPFNKLLSSITVWAQSLPDSLLCRQWKAQDKEHQ